jgi:archaellum component FlaG (FlaF/FlaG flagellin family)
MEKSNILLFFIVLIITGICFSGCISTRQPSPYSLNITINEAIKTAPSVLNSMIQSNNKLANLSNGYDYLLLNVTIQNTGNNDFSFTSKSFEIIGDLSQSSWHPPVGADLSTTGVILASSDKPEVLSAKSNTTGTIFFSILRNTKTCKFSVLDSSGNTVAEVDNIDLNTLGNISSRSGKIPQIANEHLNITYQFSGKTTPEGYNEMAADPKMRENTTIPSFPNNDYLVMLSTSIVNAGNDNLSFDQNSFKLICIAPNFVSHNSTVVSHNADRISLQSYKGFGVAEAFLPMDQPVVFPAHSRTQGIFYFENWRNATYCKFSIQDSAGHSVGELDLALLDNLTAPLPPPQH